MIPTPSSALVLFAAVTLAPLAQASAQSIQDGRINATYAVEFSGISVAKATVGIAVADGQYTAQLGYRTAGAGAALSSARGDITASGQIRADRLVPASFNMTTSASKKTRKVALAMGGGSIRSFTAEPPVDYAGTGRVPVTPETLRNSLDPLSAALMPVPTGGKFGEKVCDRVLPVFDGYQRFDLKLSYSGTVKVASPAYSGPAITCAARYVAVAGHREGNKNTKFWEENQGLSVTLIPLGTLPYAAPYAVTVQTQWGTIEVAAASIDFNGKIKAADATPVKAPAAP